LDQYCRWGASAGSKAAADGSGLGPGLCPRQEGLGVLARLGEEPIKDKAAGCCSLLSAASWARVSEKSLNSVSQEGGVPAPQAAAKG